MKIDLNKYLDAVDEVCFNCIKIDEDVCESCPVRQTVDCLYSFAPYEIWFAKEDDWTWKDCFEPTKNFKQLNVSGDFRTYDVQLFKEVLSSLTENPVASWFWVCVNGEPITWGAMDSESYDVVAEYLGW